ncbi:hypothetical protein EOT10_36900 [Streptomyces antnestii]|uniref:Uncharacterized protein n=1 Tax=Streptomyces antnestii TaxID=2494256 RepID=A0A3S2VSL2_9ACTN|nr:hypothetical protein [Streptomyces sp. San01]RVU16254.1 hypothetical protein EOT10_36900 [Streptomyces sp. San01]
MPGNNTETNIRLAPCAVDALKTLTSRRETSRDATIRQLLAEHVQRQEQQRYPEDRLTHISTVLRYPPPPLWRGAPREDVPVRVRAPAALLERARAMSLRLPGQYQRAHRDYQARLLTDAVTTAIAVAQPFTDDFLNGLMPVLRHGAALGLWRLAVAASSTRPELEVLTRAEQILKATRRRNFEETHILRVAALLESDVAWHSQERFRTAEALARGYLTGRRAKKWEDVLASQDARWGREYQGWLRRELTAPTRRRYAMPGYDWTGRGGSAVWRAEHQLQMDYFEQWLVERTDPGSGRIDAVAARDPNWLLRIPTDWRAHFTPAGAAGEPYQAWAAEGRLLAFPCRARRGLVFWPLLSCADVPVGRPVPGFEAAATAAASLRPEQITGFIEALLIDWNHRTAHDPDEFDDPDVGLRLPVAKARRFGLLTSQEEHRLMSCARESTLRSMDAYIEWAVFGGADSGWVERMKQARCDGDATAFMRVTRAHTKKGKGKPFSITRATWRWPGRSVAAELASGRRLPDVVQWLATESHRQRGLALEQAMERTWRNTVDRFGFRLWEV